MSKKIFQNLLKITFLIMIFEGPYEQGACYGMWFDAMGDSSYFSGARHVEQNWPCTNSTHGLRKTEHCSLCASRYPQKLDRVKNAKKTPPAETLDKGSDIKINEIKPENDNIENILAQWAWMGDIHQLLGYNKNNPF